MYATITLPTTEADRQLRLEISDGSIDVQIIQWSDIKANCQVRTDELIKALDAIRKLSAE